MSKTIIAIVIIMIIVVLGYWIYQSIILPKEEAVSEGSRDCIQDEDCIVFGKTGDCNCGCYNKDNLPLGTGGECFCAAPVSCKCINGKCEGVFEELMTVKLFFSNSILDPEISCNKVFPVEREVPETLGVAKVALEELFKGPTEEEKNQGYVSWFSQETEDILKSVKIENNTAYVNLKDIRQIIPNVSTSCGSAEFLAEVETTLKQFSTVERVIIAIEDKPSTFYEWIQIGCAKENDFCDETPFKTSNKESTENFSKIGNIVKNNPGLKKGCLVFTLRATRFPSPDH